MVRHALGAFGEMGAPVEVDLAARTAGPGLGHPPEVLVVAPLDVAPARHPLRRQADLVAPDRPGDFVVGVGRGGEALGGDPELLGEELPGPVDRLALEVVAEAPVAHHLEEGVVAGRAPDLLEVVVLAGDPQAALHVDGARVAPLLGPGEDLLELDHARVREQEGLIAGWDQAGAGHDRVAAPGEEVEEARRTSAAGRAFTGVGGVSRGRHPANGTERRARHGFGARAGRRQPGGLSGGPSSAGPPSPQPVRPRRRRPRGRAGRR